MIGTSSFWLSGWSRFALHECESRIAILRAQSPRRASGRQAIEPRRNQSVGLAKVPVFARAGRARVDRAKQVPGRQNMEAHCRNTPRRRGKIARHAQCLVATVLAKLSAPFFSSSQTAGYHACVRPVAVLCPSGGCTGEPCVDSSNGWLGGPYRPVYRQQLK
jgi:hypothetical protein